MKWIEQRETVERNSGNQNCQYPVGNFLRNQETEYEQIHCMYLRGIGMLGGKEG